MLEIINNLKPFFEDCYRRISVREFSRTRKISPPTASKWLEELFKEGLLKKEKHKPYIYYFADKDSGNFIGLSHIYWQNRLEKSGLLKYLEEILLSPIIILFGSLAKAEAKADSDIDLAVFSVSKKKLDLKRFEKKLKRKIQLFQFKDLDDVKSKRLRNNILNGHKLKGSW